MDLMIYVLERFVEGAGATLCVPLIAALLIRSSPAASARAAFIATVGMFAIVNLISWQVPDREPMISSYIVFGVLFPVIVFVVGSCVGALRRNMTERNDGTEPLR